MSLSFLISDLKTKIFGQTKQKLSKNIPKINNEYIPGLEAGEGGFNRRLKQRQLELELYYITMIQLQDILSNEDNYANFNLFNSSISLLIWFQLTFVWATPLVR